MALKDLRLRLVLDVIDKALAPIKRIGAGSQAMGEKLREARDELKKLRLQDSAIGSFRAMGNEFKASSAKAQVLRARLAELRATTPATTEEAKKLAKEVGNTERQLKRAAAAVDEKQRKLEGLRERMKTVGVKNLAQDEATLASRMAAANQQIEEQQTRLEKLAKLRQRHAKQMMQVGMVGGAGVAAMAAGRRGMDAALKPVGSYMAHEDAMLGIARQVEGARDAQGKLTAIYRAAEKDVRDLSLEVPLPTTAIAEMMTAAARMEVPTDQLRDQVKLAAEMAIAFDAVPDEIAESMGKVAKNFKIPLTQMRSLGDAINYLDDNAISKGADIIDFLNRTSGVVSTVAMSAPQAAALGSTLLTLGERTEAAGTAANAIVQKFAAATKGTKKFQSAVKEIGLSSAALQKGMSTDATDTLITVIEAIRKLPKDKRIGVMVELVGMEHSDTLAKLVDKPEELKRQLKLATGGAGDGSMGREAAARNNTLSAKKQIAENRGFNLSSVLGESLRPTLEEVNKSLSPVVDKVTKWAAENPKLTGGILAAVLGVSALALGAGALGIAFASIAGPILLAKLMFATLGMSAMGAFVAMLPVLLAVGLLAAAAYLVWSNWDGIIGGLKALWEDFADGIRDKVESIGGYAVRFGQFGMDMMKGLASGIWNGLAWVGDAINGVASSTVSWFKEKLGIHSPSRVFMALGQNIPEGAALGIQRGSSLLRGAALAMATVPLTAAAGMGGGPLMASGAGGGASVGGGSYQITINAPAGADPQAIARAVSAELDRREGRQRRAVLSQMADIDG